MLTFSAVLKSENVEPSRVTLIRHKDARLRQRTLFDIWFSDRELFEAYQSIQPAKNNLPVGHVLASFVVTAANDTVFVGCYDIVSSNVIGEGELDPVNGSVLSPSMLRHSLAPIPALSPYVSRLVIKPWRDAINYVKRADRADPEILELRREDYDEPFPGHLKFARRLGDMTKIYRSWQDQLAVRGVYLFTFDDGVHYVGSATGAAGFTQRWADYLNNGHGGNASLQLRDARQATVSILEVAGSSHSREDVLAMESMWKRKLGKGVQALNEN
jgi:hypothetical protein